jgi:hypothetical protein
LPNKPDKNPTPAPITTITTNSGRPTPTSQPSQK